MKTYKLHPKHKNLKVSNCGTIVKQHNITLPIREVYPKPNCPLMVVYMNDTYYSLPKIVLETYTGYTKDTKKRYAICIDGNHKNTHPSNLKWGLPYLNYTPAKTLKKKLASSKLDEGASYRCYLMYTQKKASLATLAKEYGVSDMSVHRAVKRIEKYLNA